MCKCSAFDLEGTEGKRDVLLFSGLLRCRGFDSDILASVGLAYLTFFTTE